MHEATPTPSHESRSLALLLRDPATRIAALAAHLDALSPGVRIAECRALDKAAMRRLWDAAADAPPLTLDDLVPPGADEGVTVRFAGKNSLPTLTHFEKHFARHRGDVVGINVQAMTPLTGPGYYTARAAGVDHPAEVLFDYTRVPRDAPPGWPAPKSNSAGISFLVFRNLHDYNRKVSRDVVIGSATRMGAPMDSYYVLARMP